MRIHTKLAGLIGLFLVTAAFALHAAPPDRDGDTYSVKDDCNDNDPEVWQLNSCGQCAPESQCSGPSCTDDDVDGYAIEGGNCGPVDCNDTDAGVNPGAVEICGDAIDNNCSGEVNEGCTASSRDVIVVATNDLGMHCACPGSEYFMLLPPFNTFRAQVIERGGQSPVVLDDPNDIRVEYDVVENTERSLAGGLDPLTQELTQEGGFDPVTQTCGDSPADPYYCKWMEMMPKYGFGPATNADGKIQGLTGATLDGEMHAKTGEGWWEVIGVPVFLDVSSNSSEEDKVMIDALGPSNPNRNPYLSVNVNVYDQSNDALLATTTTVAPVAFGGCCNCHLSVAESHGKENPTPKDSFEVMGQLHKDNGSGIDIARIDPDGDLTPGPVRCSACHLDPAMGESVPPGGYTDMDTGAELSVSQFTFSDVLHRGHLQNQAALDMDPDLKDNCYNCHPGNGVNCYRGHHVNKPGAEGTMWCTDCHGDLVQRVAEGQLEKPWSEETLPACSDCHQGTGELNSRSRSHLHLGVFGSYLNSRGHKSDKILCSTCHGAPHALYPSMLAKDNQQILGLQGLENPIGVCDVCHVGKSINYDVPNH